MLTSIYIDITSHLMFTCYKNFIHGPCDDSDDKENDLMEKTVA